MKTEILDTKTEKEKSINIALEWLRAGMPIVFPTETVYGIGAGIFDINAVEKVYKIKGRDFKNPLSAHISSIKDAEMLCTEIKDEFYLLAEKFLPGPLSIVMNKKSEVPDLVTGGGNTLSIRFPDNEVFLQLSRKFGQPIAATSANLSGKPSPVTANHVFDDLAGKVPIILDYGLCRYQVESTVISLCGENPVLIRPGAVSQSEISKVLGRELISVNRQIAVFDHKKSSLDNSKFKIICFDNFQEITDFYKANSDKKILIMSHENFSQNISNIVKTDSATFFGTLRDAERSGIEYILIEKDEYVISNEVLRHRLKLN